MSSFIIEGGTKLKGEVRISGSKNASLPIIAASILNGGKTTLYNVPNIHDTQITLKILKKLGCKIKKKQGKDRNQFNVHNTKRNIRGFNERDEIYRNISRSTYWKI